MIELQCCVTHPSFTNLPPQFFYVGVQGQDVQNTFTLLALDDIFSPSEASINVLEGDTGAVYEVADSLTSDADGVT